MFKVTMTELGRNKTTISKDFENEPDYSDLYQMASRELLSGTIDFDVTQGSPDDGEYPVSGKVVVGGFRSVGNFEIIKLEVQK